MLDKEFSVVTDLGPHVIDQEGFCEVVLIIWEGHGFEMESHCSSTFDIAKLVLASWGVAVSVEELGKGSSVLREEGVASALVPFLVVVQHMICLWGEKFIELFVLENLIQDPNFINTWLSTSVSNSGQSDKSGEGEVNLPDCGLVEHQEAESCVG